MTGLQAQWAQDDDTLEEIGLLMLIAAVILIVVAVVQGLFTRKKKI